MQINKLSPQMVRKVEQEVNTFNAKLNRGKNKSEGSDGSNLGKNEFLKILTVQLSHQNPLQPMDNTKFISQMAQFTSLEQMQNMNKTLGDLKGDFTEIKSASLIGKKAKYFDIAGSLKEGVVSEIKLKSQNKVVINGEEVLLKDIDSIQEAAAQSTEFHPPMIYRQKAISSYLNNGK